MADLIITSDWHLRDTTPICRVDDFETTQWRKVDFISRLQRRLKCPVIHAGDLFEKWKPSPYLLAKTIEHLPKDFYTIYGNHDLPQHNIELKNRCGVYVLEKANVLTVIDGRHWNVDYNENQWFEIEGRKIHMAHIMTYQGKTPYPGCTDTPASGLLRKYKDFDLIITGHNHMQFVEKHNGRLLLNPGSLTRQSSNERGWKPCVWVWCAKDNSLEQVFLPVESDAVQVPERIAEKEQREERIDAFISRLNTEWGEEMDFEANIRKAIAVNDVPKSIQDIIYKAVEI
jgi:putative phosphoesterase